jgi:Fe2+ or Zn2+ uptake regulation protein
MPKINEVISNLKLTPLQRKVLAYLQNHNDEVFQYKDLNELAKLIKHHSPRGVASSLWTLASKGMISKTRIGRKIYYGSKEAIDYLLKGLNKERTDKKHDPYILQFISRLPQALADVLEVIFIMRHDEVSRIKATAHRKLIPYWKTTIIKSSKFY